MLDFNNFKEEDYYIVNERWKVVLIDIWTNVASVSVNPRLNFINCFIPQE